MIEVRYVSSNGREYNLITDHIRPTSGTFHSYEWKANEAEIENGTEVYAWTKDPITYQITVTVRGSISERKRILNELTSAFEYDIANISPGRLYFDEYYIECFAKSGENTISDTAITRSDFKINLYCPYAFWIKEETKSFFKDESKNSEYEYLAYPYGYSYDYSKPGQGAENWYINHHRNSHFKMVVYGPCANPRIMIGDHIYEVRDILENDEYRLVCRQAAGQQGRRHTGQYIPAAAPGKARVAGGIHACTAIRRSYNGAGTLEYHHDVPFFCILLCNFLTVGADFCHGKAGEPGHFTGMRRKD